MTDRPERVWLLPVLNREWIRRTADRLGVAPPLSDVEVVAVGNEVAAHYADGSEIDAMVDVAIGKVRPGAGREEG